LWINVDVIVVALSLCWSL